MPVQYDDKKIRISDIENEGDIPVKGWTNQLTRDFKTKGYVVLKDFIPKEIIQMTMDSWLTIENNEKWNDMFFVREDDIIHNSPTDSLRKSQGCHTFPPSVGMHHWLRNALESVLDMHLVETYAYSRKYDRGAFLKAHSDRPSCEVSATICLKYKTDDNTPWKIWVQRDKNYIDLARGDGSEKFYEEMQAIPHRERKGIPITLEVGDVLLYQGPNAVHWRDYLLGDYSYHMFLHFINDSGKISHLDRFQQPKVRPRSDGRAHSVFAYDGRKSRYHHEQQKYFTDAMNFWNEWSSGAHDWFKPSDFINNYTEEEVELTDREKQRLEDDSI
tara:strand:- start:302 stop:1288 length:987 start_codon:yes stop_codon:yes gene_type:complete